jgi:hypothetical protein
MARSRGARRQALTLALPLNQLDPRCALFDRQGDETSGAGFPEIRLKNRSEWRHHVRL